MSREIDRRDFSENRVSPGRGEELESLAAEVSDRLPGDHRVAVAMMDATTGNPATVTSEAAPAHDGDYVSRALDHVRAISPVLGLTGQAPEFVADSTVQQASSGAKAVHLQQRYKGIPIFEAAETVQFAPDGSLTQTVGSTISVDQDLAVAPRLSVQQAALRAAQHLAEPDEDELDATDPFGEPLTPSSVDVSGFEPRIRATFPGTPEQSTVLEAGPFGADIKASLVWFPLQGRLSLGWEFLFTMPNDEDQYYAIVDADSGEILYCQQTIQTVRAVGNVYRVDGSSDRQRTDFPRPIADYGIVQPGPPPLPAAFPDDWVTSSETVGNSTNAHLGESNVVGRGKEENGLVIFDPDDPVGDDQKILNIFYLNCYMHDYFYLLGFREADGNFQQDSLGRGGVASDRVDARSHPGAVRGTANMLTPVDGTAPIMNMGLVTSTNRHTAFDSTVVYHEFMHGVTNRLVGGPMNSNALRSPQSGGMGEGWGDFIGCIINDMTVVGAWVVDRPGGIRGFPYDSNFPDGFGELGKGRYTEVHNIGEIWCATLMEMSRRVGKNLAVQLVVDALKLSPANPSFLNMRDAILGALDHMRAAGQLGDDQHASTLEGIWAAFAQFGMGPGAGSNGAQLTGIVADTSTP